MGLRLTYSRNCLLCWPIALLRLILRRMGVSPRMGASLIPTVMQRRRVGASPIPTVIRLYFWFSVGAATRKRTPKYTAWHGSYGKGGTIAPLKWLFRVLPCPPCRKDSNAVWSTVSPASWSFPIFSIQVSSSSVSLKRLQRWLLCTLSANFVSHNIWARIHAWIYWPNI